MEDIEILKISGKIKEDILIDSGAKSNVVSFEFMKKIGLENDIRPTKVMFMAANKSDLDIKGEIDLEIEWSKERNIL